MYSIHDLATKGARKNRVKKEQGTKATDVPVRRLY
jgi:hypothetical protein